MMSGEGVIRLAEEEDRLGTVTEFQDYDIPLEIVSSFKYMRRLLTATSNEWPVVIANLRKDRKSWSFLDHILGW